MAVVTERWHAHDERTEHAGLNAQPRLRRLVKNVCRLHGLDRIGDPARD